MLTQPKLKTLVTKNQGHCKHENNTNKKVAYLLLGFKISLENYCHTQIDHKLNKTHLSPFLHLY
jgi:hypothetical protein